jgi:hypothetical protein
MSTATVPVHVATGIDEAGFFADWPIDDLDEAISLLGRWGLTDSEGDDTDAQQNAVGEFIHTGKRIIFRITVMD